MEATFPAKMLAVQFNAYSQRWPGLGFSVPARKKGRKKVYGPWVWAEDTERRFPARGAGVGWSMHGASASGLAAEVQEPGLVFKQRQRQRRAGRGEAEAEAGQGHTQSFSTG